MNSGNDVLYFRKAQIEKEEEEAKYKRRKSRAAEKGQAQADDDIDLDQKEETISITGTLSDDFLKIDPMMKSQFKLNTIEDRKIQLLFIQGIYLLYL